jgi:hypothetical protein
MQMGRPRVLRDGLIEGNTYGPMREAVWERQLGEGGAFLSIKVTAQAQLRDAFSLGQHRPASHPRQRPDWQRGALQFIAPRPASMKS